MWIKKWEELDPRLQNDSVRPYYEKLKKKKLSLLGKRVFDICLSAVMLILLSPVFLVLGIWIKSESPGPVFFRQERVTTGGKPFRIFKFRTMVNHAQEMGSSVTVKNDSRITRVGAKIRNHRLDEFPQLINVFLGQMSFVGTRPEVQKYVAAYTDEMYATLLLPAGITSLASIKFKDEERLLEGAQDVDKRYIEVVLPQKMKYNLEYVKDYRFLNDLKLCIRTVISV